VYYNNLKITRQRGTLNNYYPFGLMWDNPDAMPNATYQGKEFQTNTFSDGSELALYDFGARMYDPVLGRWHCSDPMYQFDSPYNAMANNPVVNIDPDGMWSIPWGNIMISIGGFLSSMTKTTITGYSSIPFMSKLTATTQPNLGSGTAVSGAAMLLQAGLDGKKIQDAARNSGLDKFPQLSNTLNAPVPSNWALQGYQTYPITIDAAKTGIENGNGYYNGDGGDLDKIFFNPNYDDCNARVRGSYFACRPNKRTTGWSSRTPINVGMDANGFLDDTTKSLVASEFAQAESNLLSATSSGVFIDSYSPIKMTIYGGGEFSSSDKKLAQNIENQIRQLIDLNYSNQYHYHYSDDSSYANSSGGIWNTIGLRDGQIAFELTYKINVYGF
jgi:RHS repeat-associated protein